MDFSSFWHLIPECLVVYWGKLIDCQVQEILDLTAVQSS